MNQSGPSTFIRCWDVKLNRELKIRVMRHLPTEAAVRDLLTRNFRNLDYREHAPWNDAEHRGVLYAIPIQNVLFDPPKIIVDKPDQIRRSLLIRKPFPRNPPPKGA